MTNTDNSRRKDDARPAETLHWDTACSICAGAGTTFGKTCVCRAAEAKRASLTDALRHAALDLLEHNASAGACIEIAGEPPLYVLVGPAGAIGKLLPEAAAPGVSEQADERALFEDAVRAINPKALILERWPDGSYKHHGTDGRWHGWQMARATQQAAPEACAHCKRLPGDPEGFCDWIECPVGCPTLVAAPEAPHPDELAVDRFAVAMKEKLAKKRSEGRGGWETPECTDEYLAELLMGHTKKGDPVDVANLAMMLHQRNIGHTDIAVLVLRGAALEFAKRTAPMFVPVAAPEAPTLPADLIADLREAIQVAQNRAEQTGYTFRETHWISVRERLNAAVTASTGAAPEAPASEPYCIALHSDGTTTDLTHLMASPAATTASASIEAAWFHKISEYGPWIECNPSAPGAVRFFSDCAPASSPTAIDDAQLHLLLQMVEQGGVTIETAKRRIRAALANKNGESHE